MFGCLSCFWICPSRYVRSAVSSSSAERTFSANVPPDFTFRTLYTSALDPFPRRSWTSKRPNRSSLTGRSSAAVRIPCARRSPTSVAPPSRRAFDNRSASGSRERSSRPRSAAPVRASATLAVASPSAIAVSPSIGRASQVISFVRAVPTILESRVSPPAAGTRPISISGNRNDAAGPTTRRSQASASSKPPPIAGPCTAAIDTNVALASASNVRWLRRSTTSSTVRSAISVRSAPAQNAPSPVEATMATATFSWSDAIPSSSASRWARS